MTDYSSSFRLTYQGPGDNINTWGDVLRRGVFQLLEDGIVGSTPITGSVDLTQVQGGTVNGAADKARSMVSRLPRTPLALPHGRGQLQLRPRTAASAQYLSLITPRQISRSTEYRPHR